VTTRCSPYSQAIRYLSVRDHSRAQLRTKLLRSFDRGQVEQLLDRLEEEKLLDDSRYAAQRALFARRQKLWGDRKIAAYLRHQGVDEQIVRSALRALDGESSQTDALQALIEAWIRKSGKPRSPSQVRRLRDHCLRRGYPPALVRRVLMKGLGGEWRVE
jgi:regulatory protein